MLLTPDDKRLYGTSVSPGSKLKHEAFEGGIAGWDVEKGTHLESLNAPLVFGGVSIFPSNGKQIIGWAAPEDSKSSDIFARFLYYQVDRPHKLNHQNVVCLDVGKGHLVLAAGFQNDGKTLLTITPTNVLAWDPEKELSVPSPPSHSTKTSSLRQQNQPKRTPPGQRQAPPDSQAPARADNADHPAGLGSGSVRRDKSHYMDGHEIWRDGQDIMRAPEVQWKGPGTISADGRIGAVTEGDSVRLIDLEKKELLLLVGRNAPFRIALNANGSRLVIQYDGSTDADKVGQVAVVDTATGHVIRHFDGQVLSIACDPGR